MESLVVMFHERGDEDRLSIAVHLIEGDDPNPRQFMTGGMPVARFFQDHTDVTVDEYQRDFGRYIAEGVYGWKDQINFLSFPEQRDELRRLSVRLRKPIITFDRTRQTTVDNPPTEFCRVYPWG